MHPPKSRNQLYYLLAAVCVVFIGLASRHSQDLFPQAFGKYPGDALWALMVFFGLGCALPRCSSFRLAAYALAISFLVEISQLYQASWINAIRGTTLGHLLLGSQFDWADLSAYTVGASAGFGVEFALGRARTIPCLTEYTRPWKLSTLALGIALLILGSFYYQAPDWDIPISLIMGMLAYLTAPWSLRVFVERRWRLWPAMLFATWLTVDGCYWLYWHFKNPVALELMRDANFFASLSLYGICGVL
ncbi:MAG: DUF2809 domain-containing protein, partial [Gallionella sp.]|nr:DUF2809 domain-containing protein [Gallionella sp.]